MLYTLLRLSVYRPSLLTDHAEAYAELLAIEIRSASALWQRRLWLNALALCCMGVAAVLAGVAWMLWALAPAVNTGASWALFGAPALPGAIALGCLLVVRMRCQGAAFDELIKQVRSDAAMLRKVSAA
jgi:hypothetical protein